MKKKIIRLGGGILAAAMLAGAFLYVTRYMLLPNPVRIFYTDNAGRPKPNNGQPQVDFTERDGSQDSKVVPAGGTRTGGSLSPDGHTLTLSFFGDLMLDRSVRQHIEKQGAESLFASSEEAYRKADFSIANLEGPVADFPSRSVNTTENQGGHFSFVFDPNNLPALKARNFNILNLGNNHILNFGQAGLQQTRDNLAGQEIRFFGDPADNSLLEVEENGITAVLLSYNQFRQGSADAVKHQLEKIRPKADLVVVYTHWGSEYESQPGTGQKQLAHEFVQAGADLVIGSHPHVIQSVEQYQGKYIFYSLGNFIFDQFFSAETMKGLQVTARFDKVGRRLECELNPLAISRSFAIEVPSGERRQRELDRIAAISLGEEAFRDRIRAGKLP